MREEFKRFCTICHVSNFSEPLRAYSDGSGKLWVYLCYECEKKVLKVTGGEIPLKKLKELGGGFLGGEKTDNRCDTQKLSDLSRELSLIFGLLG
jgi:hypothetical protein